MTGPYKGVHVAPGLWSIHLASTLFTINVGHWSQVSSSGHLWSPQPGDAAKKMNVACHSLISSPDTVNFVANLPSLLPDVVTCRHVFIIANSYRRLAGKIIPLPRSSRNLQGDCCLTFMATEFVSTLDLRCQCWNADLKKNEVISLFHMGGSPHWISQFPCCWQTNPLRFVLCYLQARVSLIIAVFGFSIEFQTVFTLAGNPPINQWLTGSQNQD